MTRIYNKLIRDNIPEICEKNNQLAVTKVLDDKKYKSALKTKLIEETLEYIKSDELMELADILEVVDALSKAQGSSLDEIISLKNEKAQKNGAFDKKLLLIKTKDMRK